MKLSRGFLVSLEGIDGAGKTTLAKALCNELMERGYQVVLTKEPGSTAIGKSIRALVQDPLTAKAPETEFLLFAADRAQHIQEVVRPALEAGKIVIADRMADSSLAYQGYGRGLDKTMIQSINAWVMHDIKPDLILYVKIDPITAQERIALRQEKKAYFEQETQQFFERVIAGFETIFRQKSSVRVLDAQQAPELLVQKSLDHILTCL